MHHTIRLMIVLAIVCGQPSISGAPAYQSAAGPIKAAGDIRLATLSGFTVDYPKKDWQALGGAGSSLVVFFHKSKEATVAIERTKLQRPLAPTEIIDQTATLEIEVWGARRPLSSGFTPKIFDSDGARFILIDFTQPGAEGPEQVRMYTLPRGSDWYRVICTAKRSSFAKYLDTFHRIALSLTPTPS
jgi:hypothetical protein